MDSFGDVELIGVPVDLGANLRGVGLAPTAFRLAGLVEKLRREGIAVADGGDVRLETEPTGRSTDRIEKICAAYELLAGRVTDALRAGRIPLVIGGDHSIAIGTLAGAARHYNAVGKRMGLLWVDAHGDMNTPQTSPSGNIHGMPLAVSLGEGIPELVNLCGFSPKVDAGRCALVGVRNLDAEEKETIARFGVKVFTMKDIDRRGLATVMEEAIEVVSQQSDGLHVSFDMDVVDPKVAPGVGTAVRGGLSYREAHLVMELVHDAARLTSLEVVEANPILDEKNATARLGTELILSALGKSIY